MFMFKLMKQVCKELSIQQRLLRYKLSTNNIPVALYPLHFPFLDLLVQEQHFPVYSCSTTLTVKTSHTPRQTMCNMVPGGKNKHVTYIN